MTDRSIFRNTGVGLVLILSFIVFSNEAWEWVWEHLHPQDVQGEWFKGLVVFLASPVIGWFVAQVGIVLLHCSGKLYNTEGRRCIARKIRSDIYNSRLPEKCALKSLFKEPDQDDGLSDSLFVLEYYSHEKSKDFVEWARRVRDSELLAQNIQVAIIMAWCAGMFFHAIRTEVAWSWIQQSLESCYFLLGLIVSVLILLYLAGIMCAFPFPCPSVRHCLAWTIPILIIAGVLILFCWHRGMYMEPHPLIRVCLLVGIDGLALICVITRCIHKTRADLAENAWAALFLSGKLDKPTPAITDGTKSES